MRCLLHKTKSLSPQCIIVKGVEHTIVAPIASVLNCYFASIGRSVVNKIFVAAAMSPVRSATKLQSFLLYEVDEETVLKYLLSLKTIKAIGLDNFSARLLKCDVHAICPSITKLLNLSINSGYFPEIWKCSKVAALFKSGDRTNVSNYCRIAILPTRSKFWKKLSILNSVIFCFQITLFQAINLAFVPNCLQHQLSPDLQMRSYCINDLMIYLEVNIITLVSKQPIKTLTVTGTIMF